MNILQIETRNRLRLPDESALKTILLEVLPDLWMDQLVSDIARQLRNANVAEWFISQRIESAFQEFKKTLKTAQYRLLIEGKQVDVMSKILANARKE